VSFIAFFVLESLLGALSLSLSLSLSHYLGAEKTCRYNYSLCKQFTTTLLEKANIPSKSVYNFRKGKIKLLLSYQ
jgi:hypothetical protein